MMKLLKLYGNCNSKTEEFWRNILVDTLEKSQHSEYFGIFKSNTSKYKIVDGHKIQLGMVVEFYKTYSKPKTNLTPSLLCHKPKSERKCV